MVSPINLTGSPSYNGRIVITGDPGCGCSSDQYKQFNTAAFSGPTYGSLGLESGRNVLQGVPRPHGGPGHCAQLPARRQPQRQFRIDLFNAFNTVVYNASRRSCS